MSDRSLATRTDLQPVPFDPTANALTAQQLLGQVALIQNIMSTAMKEGEHYGKIPGCGDKPTLLKPGAEKLCMTFRLSPQYHIEDRNLDGEHREFRILVTLLSIGSNANIGQGVGLCSTREAKYRYRGKAGRKCPQCGAAAIIKGKTEYGGGWVCFKKKDGCGAKFRDGDKAIEDQSDERLENPDIADTYNTVLKMAKKRALVDAVLTATAASDIFTQDIEEIMAHEAEFVARAERQEEQCRINHRHEQPRREPPVVDAEEVEATAHGRWQDVRVHWGKNRGMLLSELNPQQIRWYEQDWAVKKVASGGPTSAEDATLVQALKDWRAEREEGKKAAAAKAVPAPEDETQELVPPFETLKAKANADGIQPDELEDYLRTQKNAQGKPLLAADEAVINLTDERILALLTRWDKHRSGVLATRKERYAQQVLPTVEPVPF